MNRLSSLLVFCALLASAPLAITQEPGKIPPSKTGAPDENPMAALIEPMFNSVIDFLGKPETAAKVAKLHKIYLDALVAEGFTRQEALEIITSPGFLRSTGK